MNIAVNLSAVIDLLQALRGLPAPRAFCWQCVHPAHTHEVSQDLSMNIHSTSLKVVNYSVLLIAFLAFATEAQAQSPTATLNSHFA